MNLDTLLIVLSKMVDGFVHPGWQLTRLWRVSEFGDSSLYHIRFSDGNHVPHVIDIIATMRNNSVSVRRAKLSFGTKLLAYREVI